MGTTLSTKDRVVHKVHGTGVVLREWGSWKACKTCYRPYCDKHRHRANIQTGRDGLTWYYEINGEGIFDVLFDGERGIRSIHRRWLKLLVTEDGQNKIIPLQCA